MNVKIIYGTETGTTKYVAELLSEKLAERKVAVHLFQAGVDGYQPILNESDLILFGTPTYFGNMMEESFTAFTDQFQGSLSEYQIGCFVLGDSGYPNFCGAAETLEKWINKNLGQLLVPTLKLNGYPKDVQLVKNWLTELLQKATSS